MPKLQQHYTHQGGCLGCWVRIGVWLGWLVIIFGLALLWAARASAYINHQPLDGGLILLGGIGALIGCSPYLMRLLFWRNWVCANYNYRWHIR